jgi:hypothetical protein
VAEGFTKGKTGGSSCQKHDSLNQQDPKHADQLQRRDSGEPEKPLRNQRDSRRAESKVRVKGWKM